MRIPLLTLGLALVLALLPAGADHGLQRHLDTHRCSNRGGSHRDIKRGWGGHHQNGLVDFTVGNATVKAGEAVMFVDPTSGGIHHLVTGSHGTFSAEAGAPSQFATADGISFSPGDSMSIVFRRQEPTPSLARSIP